METLIALRYFVVKDQTLFPAQNQLIDLAKDNILVRGIINGAEFSTRRTEFAFRTKEFSDIDCFASLARKQKTTIGNLEKTGVYRETVDNWLELPFYINFKTQIIVAPLKESIIKLKELCNLLSNYGSFFQKNEGYSIQVEPIVDPVKFWQILETATGIFQIRFELNAPNLFGASKSATEFQRAVKEVYNQDKLEISLENKNAALTYDPETMESYRDYADSGGGNWLLRVLSGGRRRTFKSYYNARSINAEHRIDTVERLQELKYRLLTFIDEIDKELNRARDE